MSWDQIDIIAGFLVSAGMTVTVAIEMTRRTRQLTAITKKQNDELRRALQAMMVLTDIVGEIAKAGAENAKRKKN